MSRTELENKITQMEATLENPNVADGTKAMVRDSLDKAKTQLAAMEKKPKAATAAATVSKKTRTKGEFYVEMDKKFKGITLADIKAMSQADFDTKLSELLIHAKKLVPYGDATDFVHDYMNKHILKGKMPKAKAVKKTSTPAKKTETIASASATYSWQKATGISNLTPIVNHCQQYGLEVKENTVVELLGDDKHKSYQITAQPGDYLIFNQEGYLVYVMKGRSFKKACIYNTTLVDHESKLHRNADVEKLEKENANLREQVKELEAKPTAATKEPQGDTPKASSPPVAKTKKLKHGCTTTDLDDAEVIARVMDFVEEHSAQLFDKVWKIGKWFTNGNKEITGIYELRGGADAGKVLLHVKTWNATAQSKDEWYELCIDSYKLTPVAAPKKGSYKSIVSRNLLLEAYTTKGEGKYRQCARIHSDLARCRAKGNCTTDQKERYGRQTADCGNLAKRFIGSRLYGAFLHEETKKRRSKDEKYSDALRRTAAELRNEYED